MNSTNMMYHISFYIKRKQISKSISKKNCVVQKTKRETDSLHLWFYLGHLDHELVGMGYAFPSDCVMPSRNRCLEKHKS